MTDRSGGSAGERRSPDRITSGTVLVVDDSRAVRQILRRSLEQAGYRVEEAADGRQGIEACRAVRPDLVLLDVDMPVMDGIETISAMKEDDGLRDIHVLFLTARTGGADVVRGLDLGAQDYLRKPCEPAELVARVAAALRVVGRERTLAQRAQEADEASTRDPLTGLGNRRFLEVQLRAAASADRAATIGLFVLDVDHFKRVNDEEGHLTGDAVLQILARRLESVLPSGHTLVRWGGEEFVGLVPADGDHVAIVAEAARAVVGDRPFSVGVATLPITVSVGCAVGPIAGVDALVAAADAALYEAKRSGRNCVRVARGAGPPTDR